MDLKFFSCAVLNHFNSSSKPISRSVGFGKVGQPFRLALSGDGRSGSIDKSAQFVGKKRTLSRLNMAIDWINSHSS